MLINNHINFNVIKNIIFKKAINFNKLKNKHLYKSIFKILINKTTKKRNAENGIIIKKNLL